MRCVLLVKVSLSCSLVMMNTPAASPVLECLYTTISSLARRVIVLASLSSWKRDSK